MSRLDAFVAGDFDPSGFRHAEHVLVAYEALERFDFFKACQVISDGLKAVARRAGAPEKFNSTITFAFLSLIAERRADGTFSGPEDFLASNPDLTDRALLSSRYSRARLGSPLAREVALLPDLPSHPDTARV